MCQIIWGETNYAFLLQNARHASFFLVQLSKALMCNSLFNRVCWCMCPCLEPLLFHIVYQQLRIQLLGKASGFKGMASTRIWL